jgi:quercetin dioxygenase-like cupin family protein
MAKIILEPGEEFTQRHDEPSATCLLSGNVEFVVDGATMPLEVGTWVETEAGVLHRMIATGDVEAIIHCRHRSA